MYLITCYTLFDITQTGILNRHRPTEQDNTEWIHKRNTQCNFDTVLQVINLRSQPEITKIPKKSTIKFSEFTNFGYLYDEDGEIPCWSFEFIVTHGSVFNDGITELGALYDDCNDVPMIKCGTEWDKVSNKLDGTDELRNIYFEVANNG
jgi:hypothetical protein